LLSAAVAVSAAIAMAAAIAAPKARLVFRTVIHILRLRIIAKT
jgi:hypothetical protein